MADKRGDGPAQVLWTGGWDSSFRLMQLLLIERRPVHPLYVFSPTRRFAPRELQAIGRIREALLPRLPDTSLLAPLQIFLASDHPPSRELREISDSIRARVHLGTQYLMLAGVAEGRGWRGVELSIERSPDGLCDWERMVFDEPGVLNGSREAELFRFWSFPVSTLTKLDMRDIAREHGFLDVLLQRWFCHDPLWGEPCGRCHACSLAIRDGVTFAPPTAVQARQVLRRRRRVAGAARRVLAGR